MGTNFKHKRRRLACLALVLSVMLFVNSVNSAPDKNEDKTESQIELTLGELSRNHNLKEDATKYFLVKIDEKRYQKTQDLVVKVFSEGAYGQGDPDVYISKTNKKPNREKNSQWSCSTYGTDTCTINSKDISPGDVFYIGVRCGTTVDGECTFSIQPQLEGEILLEDALEQQLDFAPYESKLFKFKIPAQGVRGDDANRVKSVVITAAPLLPIDEKMTLQASTKGQINPKQQQKRGTPGWRKGQTLRLSEDDIDEWCTDCYVTILLDVTLAGKYQITARTNLGLQTLIEGNKIDDVAFYGDHQCYKYYVKEAKVNVNIRVAQYSGLISYVFNPKKIPDRYDDGKFKQAEFGNSALIVSSVERAGVSASTGLYYVCVFAHMTSTYSIVVQETPNDQIWRTLEDGWDEQGEVVGKQVALFVYKVPPLDFKGEDISLEFLLTSLSGETPQLFARFCKEGSLEMCGKPKVVLTEATLKGNFQQAKAVGKGLSLILDHDEQTCQADPYKGECYYTVAVLGQSKSEGDLAKFSLTTIHSQQNYYILQEGTTIQDYVNLGTYRYYSFTLPPEEKKTNNKSSSLRAKNITFVLNSLHGDADLFVSRIHKYPNRMDFEKNSVKTSDSYDIVYFDAKSPNDDLSGTTYYVAIYSFQYSTYSLSVQVDRTDKSTGGDGKDKENQIATKLALNLIEGVPVRGTISSVDGTDLYKIEVKQLEGFEKPIKIQLSQIEGGTKFLVKVGSPPTGLSDAMWQSLDNSLVIDPKKDKNFQREGTYFVMIVPKASLFDLFKHNPQYSYMLSYFTEDSYLYLKSSLPFEMKQQSSKSSKGKTADYNYFRHFVSTFNKDISLSLTVFSGTPVLYATFDPAQKWPNATTPSTFSSKQQIAMSNAALSQGKALFFPQQLMHVQNPACKSSLVESPEPCVLYASVQCEGDLDCLYALKLTYENSGPQQLIIGQPQHNSVKDGSYHYYYLTVKESNLKEGQQVVAVLNSMKRNADLYVKFLDTPQKSNPEQWELPNQNDYLYKSTALGSNQDVIKIDARRDQNLQDCFVRFNNRFGNEAECAIIYAIYSPESNNVVVNKTDINAGDKLSSRYNFVVYFDIMQLMNQVPAVGTVEQGEFQYFLYESTCVDCTILVSLSTTGSGDPDLYINFGDDRLPSRDDSDMMSSTFKSEVITINLQHQYFKSKNLKSMKGPFVLGVYGVKKSNFTLVVSQEKHPMVLLQDNTAVKSSQEPFEIMYYAWYNLNLDESKARDFRVSLNVLIGQADIYMTTFIDEAMLHPERSDINPNTQQQNILARLPKSKRDAQWIIEDITPKSGVRNREIVVVNQERNYCSQCFYLIGIVTHEAKTDYSLQLNVMDQANFNNSQILKLGELYHAAFNASQGTESVRVYRFIIDDMSSPVIISQTVANGIIETVLSFSGNGDSPIAKIRGTDSIVLSPDTPQFQVDRMYYLIIKETSGSDSADHSIMITQDRTIIRLADGVPQKIKMMSKRDLSKLMIFTIPDGGYTFSVQVKTLTEEFYPKLYVKYYPDIEQVYKNLEFPPGGEQGYFICKNWDYKLGIMSYQERFDNINGGRAGLALNLLEGIPSDNRSEEAEVYITVSASPVIKMVTGNSYIGTLDHTTSFKIYQVDDSLLSKQSGYLMVEFSPCIGDVEYTLTDNPSKQSSGDIAASDKVFRNGRYIQYVALPRKNLYVMVKQAQFIGNSKGASLTNDLEGGDVSGDFMLRVRYKENKATHDNDLVTPNNGKLSFKYLDSTGGILMDWGAVYQSDVKGQSLRNDQTVKYLVIASKDKRARLDTQCALRKEVASKFVVVNFDAQDKTNFVFQTPVAGEKFYVNVFAKVLQIGEAEADLIPYTPIEIYIPSGMAKLLENLIWIIIVPVCLCLVSIAYYYCKVRKSHKQIRYEAQGGYRSYTYSGNESRYSTSTTYQDKAIELGNIHRPKPTISTTTSSASEHKPDSNRGEYQPITIGGIGNGVGDTQPV